MHSGSLLGGPLVVPLEGCAQELHEGHTIPCPTLTEGWHVGRDGRLKHRVVGDALGGREREVDLRVCGQRAEGG